MWVRCSNQRPVTGQQNSAAMPIVPGHSTCTLCTHSVLNYSTRERMLCMRLPETATGLVLHPTGFLIALALRDRIDLHHILKCAPARKCCNAGAVLDSRVSCT